MLILALSYQTDVTKPTGKYFFGATNLSLNSEKTRKDRIQDSLLWSIGYL